MSDTPDKPFETDLCNDSDQHFGLGNTIENKILIGN
jgi:hypothetical protein